MKPLLFPHGAVQGLIPLVTAWLEIQNRLATAPDENLWRLPWEEVGTWPATLGDDWLQLALKLVGHPDPPEGCIWTSHSCRKGATSSAAAIGVVESKYCYVGDWSVKSSARLDYIDPTATPTPAMFELFVWLLPISAPNQPIA
jgi:hypothetical protein